MPRDYWRELGSLIRELSEIDDLDIATKARKALACYNRCVVDADVMDDDLEDEGFDDLFRDY